MPPIGHFTGYSEMSKNLAKQYENEVIDEKNEEIRDIYEESDRIESDAEYGQYATEEEVKEYCSKWNGIVVKTLGKLKWQLKELSCI